MVFEDMANYAANKALRKLGIREEKSAPVVVVPNGSYEFSSGEYGVEPTQCPKVGDVITLILDGVVYSGTAKEATLNNNLYIYIGNGGPVGGLDTGENHVVFFMPEYEALHIALYDEAENGIDATHSVELSFAAPPVTTPISDKYLPGGGVGGGGITKVDLSMIKIPQSQPVVVIENEDIVAQLNSAYESADPIFGVISMSYMGDDYASTSTCVLLCPTFGDGSYQLAGFDFIHNVILLAKAQDPGDPEPYWMIMVQQNNSVETGT